MTEDDILSRAARVLRVRDNAKCKMKAAEEDLRLLCRAFEQVNGARGLAPHHLAQACRARGIEV